ncbi:hypothetical protein TNIN_392591 [Trichonephila inaurata madagascariensis]|uniref:Uncharacterized protein n=1 Tax=Trichonephila inaurata madagascariensis TaxID=2747483 RepID=A0A8X6M9K2_9ARAC|nr:hypothetical protein TNIN_392591 [Trichonephila inaurata madagascariensis]
MGFILIRRADIATPRSSSLAIVPFFPHGAILVLLCTSCMCTMLQYQLVGKQQQNRQVCLRHRKNVTKYSEIHYHSVTTLVIEHALSIPAPLAISENFVLFLYLLFDPNQFEISTNFAAKVLIVATLDQ